MLKPVRSSRFKKDYKKVKRQNKDLDELKRIMSLLANKKSLEPKHYDHSLSGDFKKYRECHIGSDWLLIHRVKEPKIIFERTGSHSELFR